MISARFEAALATFVDKVKVDPNVLAVIVIGSLANDVVWEKSDMDVTVLVKDLKLMAYSFCIEEDGLIINVGLYDEFKFKRSQERSLGGGFGQSFYNKARVVYAKDDTLKTFLDDLQKTGEDDRALTFFQLTAGLVYYMEKIEKWLTIKADPAYAQYWVLKAADSYANMVLVADRKPLSREAVLKVMEYAPEKIEHLYLRPMRGMMTHDEVVYVIEFFRGFLHDNIDLIRKPVDDYMNDGDVRTVTALVKHFGGSSHDIYHIFDFLEEYGIVGRVSEPVKITPKSRRTADEVAYIYIENEAQL